MAATCPGCGKNFAATAARCPFCNTPNPDAPAHVSAAMAGAKPAAGIRIEDRPPPPVLVDLHAESVARAAEPPPPPGFLQRANARFAAWPAERQAAVVMFSMSGCALLDAPLLLRAHFRAPDDAPLWLLLLSLAVAGGLAVLARHASRVRPRRLWLALGAYLLEFGFTQSPLPLVIVLIKLLPALLGIKLAVETSASEWVEAQSGS